MIVKQWKQNFLLYMLLIISAVMVFFLYCMHFNKLYDTDDIQMRRLFPTQFTFDNFINIFQKVPLLHTYITV